MKTPPSWPAPAKLNLMLHIVGRREDGYHLLQTVFQLLDVGDRLRFRLREDGRIVRRSEIPGVAADEDLCVRAARLLQAHAGCRRGCEIELDKMLPMGGGLGGGSSDAATTLVALNHLWGLGLDRATLAERGLQLGADVPVFVHGHSAWGEGVGERLTPLELPSRWYVVLHPGVHISTAELFAAPELKRDCPPLAAADYVPGMGENVFQPLVVARYPAVAEALDWLGRFAPARLTGTGACVFAAFEDEAAARAVLAQCPAKMTGFVARGVMNSPLISVMAQLSCVDGNR